MGLLSLIDPLSPLFWFIGGAVLLGIEILLPAFLALGFGLGAWALALLLLVLPADGLSPALALLIWAVFSTVAWLIMRFVFRNRFSGSDGSDGDINEY